MLDIRRTSSIEKEEILSLLKENMRFFFLNNIGGWSDETSKKQFEQINESGYSYVFYLDGVLVGYFSFYEEPNKKDSYILNDIQIKKGYQKRGLGSEVLSFIENKVRDLNGTRIKLLVFKDNPALNFYSKNNYNQVDYLERSNTCVMVKLL